MSRCSRRGWHGGYLWHEVFAAGPAAEPRRSPPERFTIDGHVADRIDLARRGGEGQRQGGAAAAWRASGGGCGSPLSFYGEAPAAGVASFCVSPNGRTRRPPRMPGPVPDGRGGRPVRTI